MNMGIENTMVNKYKSKLKNFLTEPQISQIVSVARITYGVEREDEHSYDGESVIEWVFEGSLDAGRATDEELDAVLNLYTETRNAYAEANINNLAKFTNKYSDKFSDEALTGLRNLVHDQVAPEIVFRDGSLKEHQFKDFLNLLYEDYLSIKLSEDDEKELYEIYKKFVWWAWDNWVEE